MFAQIGMGLGEGFEGSGDGGGVDFDGVLTGGVGAQGSWDEDGHLQGSLPVRLDSAGGGFDAGRAGAKSKLKSNRRSFDSGRRGDYASLRMTSLYFDKVDGHFPYSG